MSTVFTTTVARPLNVNCPEEADAQRNVRATRPDRQLCLASPQGRFAGCVRPPGHAGAHISTADLGERVLARWFDTEE